MSPALAHVVDITAGLLLLISGAVAIGRQQRGFGAALVATAITWFAGSLWAPLVYLHRGPMIAVLVCARFRRPAPKWFVLIAAAAIDGAFPSLARLGPVTLCLAAAAGCIAMAATRPTLLARIGRIAAWLYASILVVVGILRTFGWIAGAAPGTAYGMVVAAIAAAFALQDLCFKTPTPAMPYANNSATSVQSRLLPDP